LCVNISTSGSSQQEGFLQLPGGRSSQKTALLLEIPPQAISCGTSPLQASVFPLCHKTSRFPKRIQRADHHPINTGTINPPQSEFPAPRNISAFLISLHH
ncbi:hypothetical protein GOODEAATRI_021613, partial [Goodea atripinnis]